MTTEQINQTIHEAMGSHPNTWIVGRGKYLNPSYTSSWVDYGEALEWAMRQHWWCNFVLKSLFDDDGRTKYYSITAVGQFKFLLDPVKGSKLLAEFIVANPQYFGRKDYDTLLTEIDTLRKEDEEGDKGSKK